MIQSNLEKIERFFWIILNPFVFFESSAWTEKTLSNKKKKYIKIEHLKLHISF